ncbi:MAG: type 4a pilus biogenesis protein PilO [Candidatus Wildermuthbacteria bacterium]|nr:type 4a pilus biogenesis protein PilO [Candidatus Wildermuthbacteria bacterium]
MKKPFLVIALFALAVLVLVFWTWPKLQRYSLALEALGVLNSELESRENYFSELASLNSELKKQEEGLSRLDAALPNAPALPQLYDAVQDIAASSGLVLSSVSSVVQDDAKLKNIDVNVTLLGTYAALKEFLKGVQQSSRLMMVQSLDFKTPKEGSRFEFHITLRASSY